MLCRSFLLVPGAPSAGDRGVYFHTFTIAPVYERTIQQSSRFAQDRNQACLHSCFPRPVVVLYATRKDREFYSGAGSMTQKILVIEDEEGIVHLLNLYLRDAGYGVVVARDGADGLAMHAREHPSLVIRDIML